MELSINILKLNLQEFAPSVRGSGSDTSIRNVRIASSSVPEADDTPYIGRQSLYFPAGSSNGDQIVCRHKDTYLFLNTEDPNPVINRILDILAHYAVWEADLLSPRSYACTLQEFIEKSRELIHSPILIINQAQEIIAQTGTEEEDFQVVSSTDIETLVEFNQNYPDFRKRKDLYYIPKGYFKTDGYNKNIFVNDRYYATAVLMVCQEVSPGILDLFELFLSYLEQWVQNSISEMDESQFNQTITRILNNDTAAIPTLERILVLNHWEKDDRKVCCFAKAVSPASQMDTYLCHQLSINLKQVMACSYNDGILILADISRTERQSFQKELKYYLKLAQYYCGASFPFCSLDELHNAYLQALFSLQKGEKETGGIYCCKDFALDYLLKHTANTADIDMLHPLLARLRSYDDENHTDYYHTLEAYLNNERNHQKTAEALFIHRNTLFHRLNKIRDICSPNLEDPNERFFLLLSFRLRAHLD